MIWELDLMATYDDEKSMVSQEDYATDDLSLLGTVFDNRFEILEILGKGATGTVYKAREALLDRTVAIKVIHSYLLSNPSAVDRFKNEAVNSSKLSHVNIARVYSCGVANDGRLYMVMDLLKGRSLADCIKRDGKLELSKFFDLFLQLADGIIYAHHHGAVHRDIKPRNIVVIPEVGQDRAVLVDFGIAKWMEQNSSQSSTQTGLLLGSSSYMSPEQCQGKVVDARSDVYSFAVVMYECLTGNTPFQGDSPMDVMYKHIHEPVGNLPAMKLLPKELARIISKCMQKEPGLRYQNFDELRSDLLACSLNRAELQEEIAKSGPRRNRWNKQSTLYSIVVILLFLSFGVGYFWIKASSLNNTKETIRVIEKKNVLPDLHSCSLPRNIEELRSLRNRFLRTDRRSEFRIFCKRWLDKYKDLPPDNESKQWCYREYFDLLQQFGPEDEAERIAQILLKEQNSARTVAAVASYHVDRLLKDDKCKEAVSIATQNLDKVRKPLLDAGTINEIVALNKLLNMRAAAYYKCKDYEKAYESYKESYHIRLDYCHNAQEFGGNVFDLADMARGLAMCMPRVGKSAEIKSIADECCLAAVEDPKANFKPADVYELIAQSLFEGGDLDLSLFYFKKALKEMQLLHRSVDEARIRSVVTNMERSRSLR